MTKRLLHYAQRADQLSWPEFEAENRHHLLVIMPVGEDQDSPLDTHQCISRPDTEVRPKMSGEFRVGVLKKRYYGGPAEDTVTVGRSGSNDIVLGDIEVSKTHSFFAVGESGDWTVRDGGSTNGTFVNDCLISEESWTTIASMDVLQFSRSIHAVFFYPGDFYRFLRSPEVRTILDES